MSVVFFSYTHKDEALRDELEIHLSLLKREGLIEAWHDRRIGAGDEFDRTISENLEVADVILLLVSPYFIASDYCFEKEMKRAMERHEEGSAKVIPVILDPCDWHSAPFGKLIALPTDGKPITKYPNQHDGFLSVVQGVRDRVSQSAPKLILEQTMTVPGKPTSRALPDERSSNLRVRKDFTQKERDSFLEDTFDYLATFFEGSLRELEARNREIDSKFRRVDANTFSAVIYRDGSSASECRISLGGSMGRDSVYYTSQIGGHSNSYSEALSVDDDGHTLHLKPMGLGYMGGSDGNRSEKLTRQGAAEFYWGMLIQSLQ